MRRHKYGANAVEVDGIKFPSTKQARRWQELVLLERAGEIRDLQREVNIPLVVNGELLGHYRADATYRERDGTMVVEDVKGYRTDMYKWKRKHVRAQYGVEIREI